MKPIEIIKDIKKGCGSEFSVNDKLCPICQSKLQIAKQMQDSFIEMINKIDEFKWLHNNFLKRQSKGCMDEEAFCFTLKEIKERLRQEVEDEEI